MDVAAVFDLDTVEDVSIVRGDEVAVVDRAVAGDDVRVVGGGVTVGVAEEAVPAEDAESVVAAAGELDGSGEVWERDMLNVRLESRRINAWGWEKEAC